SVSAGQPTLSVVSSTPSTCLGKTATLTASGALTYTWSHSVSNGVSFYPSATQTYTVTGDNGCGVVTATTSIAVNPLPITLVSTNSVVCTNKTATLTVTAPATSYTWQPVNASGTNTTLVVNPQATTVYTVTASDGTCSGVANVSIQADPIPTISASSSTGNICPGATVGLSATGGINYTWTTVSMTGSAITVTPSTSTLYNVTGDNSFGCLNNASQVVVVNSQPTLVVSANTSSICGGSSATLTVSGANTYAWTGGPTTTVYVVNPNLSTTYTVVGTNTANCSDIKTIDIGVYTPTISVTGDATICLGNQANLSASGANSYVWSPGPLNFQSIQVSPTVNTTYTVDGIGTLGILNCPGSATFQVIVNPVPTVTTTSVKTAICAKETNTYTATGASTYTWTSNTNTVVGPSIVVSSSVTTILVYTVTGTNAQGCAAEDYVTATIYACTGIEQSALNSQKLAVYPNPNNGEFTIQTNVSANLSVINELGQVVKQICLNENNQYRTSVSQLSNGIYFVVGDGLREKIVVNK